MFTCATIRLLYGRCMRTLPRYVTHPRAARRMCWWRNQDQRQPDSFVRSTSEILINSAVFYPQYSEKQRDRLHDTVRRDSGHRKLDKRQWNLKKCIYLMKPAYLSVFVCLSVSLPTCLSDIFSVFSEEWILAEGKLERNKQGKLNLLFVHKNKVSNKLTASLKIIFMLIVKEFGHLSHSTCAESCLQRPKLLVKLLDTVWTRLYDHYSRPEEGRLPSNSHKKITDFKSLKPKII